jgi:hypothetical protein
VSRRILPLTALLGLCALALAACGDTLQDQPIPRSQLEQLIEVRGYPVYWLGGSFHGLALSETGRDIGGAYVIRYGDCTEAGQNACVMPLSIVTSPDNSFTPGGSTPARPVRVRGVEGASTELGRSVQIPTGKVLVSIYADSPALARAAAQTMVPINQGAVPGAPLPAARSGSGFGVAPLPGQLPSILAPVPSAAQAGGSSRTAIVMRVSAHRRS